jgi:uncharacterized protein (DUF2252 family)
LKPLRSIWFVVVLAVLSVPHPARAMGGSTLEKIQAAYSPWLNIDDPLSLGIKLRALASDPYVFWRGSKDLFFAWMRENAPNWSNASSATTCVIHADLHLGNIGTYLAEGAWPALAAGPVDFDDSVELPAEVELVQLLVTTNLIAQTQAIPLDDTAKARIDSTFSSAYRAAIQNPESASRTLEDMKRFKKLLAKASRSSYESEIKKWTDSGRFRSTIRSEKGVLRDILRDAPERLAEVAAALDEAPNRSWWSVLGWSEGDSARVHVRQVARRTRIGSSGSQGLEKLMVLVNAPAVESGQALLYLKQIIPSAAERSGFATKATGSPARRVAEHMRSTLVKRPYLLESVEMGGRSYLLTMKEGWSDELDSREVRDLDDLLEATQILGTVAGIMHARTGNPAELERILEPETLGRIRALADAYIPTLMREFESLRADPQALRLIEQTEKLLSNPENGG